jgi:hypothetical protein
VEIVLMVIPGRSIGTRTQVGGLLHDVGAGKIVPQCFRPLCDDGDLFVVWDPFQRSQTVPDRRPLGLGDDAGCTAKPQGRTIIDGQFMAISRYSKNIDWATEFLRMTCSKDAMLRSMEGGIAPPRASSLGDPGMVAKLGWPAVAAEAIESGIPTPSNPAWDGLELSLRSAVSQTLLGQKTAKDALDECAREWQRNLRRAGVIK